MFPSGRRSLWAAVMRWAGQWEDPRHASLSRTSQYLLDVGLLVQFQIEAYEERGKDNAVYKEG